jgi:uncharacterized integral membrane protein (TIGR00698 family)
VTIIRDRNHCVDLPTQTTFPRISPLQRAAAFVASAAPGLLLTVAIAGTAYALRALPGLSLFSPMILAIVLGAGFHHVVGTPRRARAGVVFSMRRILRFAIILLGLQLTAGQMIAVGVNGIGVIIATLIATFLFTVWLGRRLGVERGLAQLIAAGTAICGASAVICTNTVTQARDEDAAYAVACVTVFGTIAMLAYPLLRGPLHLAPQDYGLWAGASIHEIAQVVAAAYQDSAQAGDFATIAKLSRVALLAPLVIALGLIARAGGAGEHAARVPIPWFVLGFMALAGVNSLITLPDGVRAAVAPATTFLLTVALAAMGLEIDIHKLRAKGLRPLLLALAAFLFIAGFSLMLVRTMT